MGGGNIDTTTFGRCLERGLASDGRLLRFTVKLDDCTDGKAKLCELLANFDVSIKDITHERVWLEDNYKVEVIAIVIHLEYHVVGVDEWLKLKFPLQIRVVCETRDWEHAQVLRNALYENYNDIIFSDTQLAISCDHPEPQ